MNTSLSNNKNDDLKSEFDNLFSFKDENEELKHDEFVLMSSYLSEIERLQKPLGIKRKDLAQKIGTSASYLTQVFRGDKPLNFFTIAKVQKALNIKFEVKAKVLQKETNSFNFQIKSNEEIISSVGYSKEYTPISSITISGSEFLNYEFASDNE